MRPPPLRNDVPLTPNEILPKPPTHSHVGERFTPAKNSVFDTGAHTPSMLKQIPQPSTRCNMLPIQPVVQLRPKMI